SDLLRSGPQEINNRADGRGQIDQIRFANIAAIEALLERVNDPAFDGEPRRARAAASGDPARESGPAQRQRERSADQAATVDADVFEPAFVAHSVLSTAEAIMRN